MKTFRQDPATGVDTRIAIVGMACRLPGANTITEFWRNLVDEKETLTTFTDEQLLAAGVSPKDFSHPHYVRTRGIIDDIDSFDAGFFNVTPREAELLDPQQRVFLECAWHALEDAGVDPYDTQLRISVFGGAGTPYYLVDALGNKAVKKYASGAQIVTSSDRDYLTTRASFKLNLKGPSMNVQTACSTGLVSVALGIDSLLSHQSDLVLAGGVSLEVPAHRGYIYQAGGLQSPDGRCRTFDKDAGGTVFSRGCAIVAIKRLADAIADGDQIYSVILGGAINNDGYSKISFTAPSVTGQVEVITEALELAGVHPDTINFVEAHGTATPSGDPIEVASLTEAFRQYTDERGYCRIGSVKTNIGHTDVASGGASLIKVALSLQHGIVPASLNFHESNPEIDFQASPFYVNTKTSPFVGASGAPRRALVNSFGVGGTNACMILEEPPALPLARSAPRPRDLLLLSAHDKPAFERLCEAVATQSRDPLLDMSAFTHTSRSRRRAHKYKAYVSFAGAADLSVQLEQKLTPLARTTALGAGLVFMFPGQGNQFPDMGRALYESKAVFRDVIDECATLLLSELGLDIRTVLYPDPDKRDEAAQLLARTYITQPAIFMVSYATACVFLDLGLEPELLIGHSVGEYVAATVAGVMKLEEALRMIALRGRLVYELPKGSMLAVLKSEAELAEVLPDTLDIAVVNSPELVVVSGPDEAINGFAEQMARQQVYTKLLPTSHAFHSRMMAPCLDAYRQHLRLVTLRAPTIPIISTVTGKTMTAEQATDHEYWVQHVVDAVRFDAATREAMTRDSLIFLECGPGHSLESAMRRQLPAQSQHAVISTLREDIDALAAFDMALARLWVEEKKVDFARYFGTQGCRKVEFPLLPFARTPYCIDFSANAKPDEGEKNPRKSSSTDWYSQPAWRKTAAVAHVPRVERAQGDGDSLWLVFTDDGLGDAIVAALRERGERCFSIRRGKDFYRDGEEMMLDPGRSEHFGALFGELATERCGLKIFYAWTHKPGAGGNLSIDDTTALDTAFYGLVRLERSLIERAGSPASVLILADDAFDVSGGGTVRIDRALALGPGRLLFKEHTEFTSKFINVESRHLNIANCTRFVEELIKEALLETDEAVVSYAGLARWTECFDPITLEPTHGANSLALKPGGVYLITGGAGGVGRTCSQFIAERVDAHFVWTGRSPLPERTHWDAIIAARNDEELIERLLAIREIEALGSSVRHYAVEVSDFDAMRLLRDEIEKDLGPVTGIVHAAGTAGGGVIALTDDEQYDAALRPKVHGALVLHTLFGDRPLDFVHFCSSVTALFGEAGRVDYTSANAFMDAMSQSGMWANASRVTSINWCEWSMVGMGAAWEKEKQRRKLGVARPQQVGALPAAAPEEAPELVMLRQSADESFYRVEIDPRRHWILSEHLLSGAPAMVGASFVDVLCRWALACGHTQLAIREARFVSPLIAMGSASPQLELHCSRLDGARWNFEFLSHDGDGENKAHFVGVVDVGAAGMEAELPALTDCLALCSDEPLRVRHFTSLSDPNGNVVLRYSERWDCLEALHLGDDEWVARLELPDRLVADLDSYALHPSLFDVATSCHFAHVAKYRSAYLPFGYDEMHFLAPFTQKLYVWGRPSAVQDGSGQYLRFDFVLYDDNLKPVLLLNGYTFTRIGVVGQNESSANKAKVLETLKKNDVISPDEAKQAMSRLLAQGLPQVIVYPSDFQIEFEETRPSILRRKREEKLLADQRMAKADDRPEIGTDFVEPENDIERGIAAVWSAILGVGKIGANDAFNELGGNSLLAIQVISGIGSEFGVEIKASEFKGSVTVREFADLILAKILQNHDEDTLQKLLTEQGA
ncbi:type I polyketide synthase [Paraburkholderia humisilvae]|uniref:Uncharacterized protein n=1 Tax=Paraburkholderia humisilvae TaxID=627669 RepID=A0A6J5F2V7_9BURK|nr:type I polyketide synthase [Paraburkholderia humisilvae]CAB3773118.1 hypothetical protein LMG29542_07110 [Paraburkholderia humisilvae]